MLNDVNTNAFPLEVQSDPNYKYIKINDEFDEIFYTFYLYKSDNKNYQFATLLFPGSYDYSNSIYMIYIPIIAEDFNYLTYKI